MRLPVMPPVQPMLAKAVKGIPDPAKHGGLVFEPKWDGFRCLVFRDGDEVELASRNTKPLTRYFPEVVEALLANLPERCVLDGEIVLAVGDRLEFERLQERIHPADSRVRMLAETTPAAYVAFDLLALGDEDLTGRPFEERRALLEEALADVRAAGAPDPDHHRPRDGGPVVRALRGRRPRRRGRQADGRAVPAQRADHAQDQARAHRRRGGRRLPAAQDLDRGGAAARLAPPRPVRRPGPSPAHRGVGLLHRQAARRAGRGAARRWSCDDLSEHPWGEWTEWAIANPDRVPGTQSRWSAGKDLSFTPLRPERVVEVGYDHMEGSRFRHTAQFKRWRPDRDPASCGYDQLEEPVSYDLAEVLGTARRED